MAGSRVERIGTIFSRMTGLLRSGTIKYQDRPVWFDVYRVFPPKYEPHADREASTGVEEIPNILYKEDQIRAQFFKRFGFNPGGGGGLRRLQDYTYQDPSTQFVSRYFEIQTQHPELRDEEVFDKCVGEYKLPKKGGVEDKVETEEESIASEFLRTKAPRKTLVTPESIRSLFEEAKASERNKDGEDK